VHRDNPFLASLSPGLGAFGCGHRRALDEKKTPVPSDRIKTLAIHPRTQKMALSQFSESPNRCAFERRIFFYRFSHLLFV
jgi:hypothetical protein